MEEPQKQTPKIKGYLYVLIEKFVLASAERAVKCHLMLGKNSSCETRAHCSGSPVNQVFLIEVPDEKNIRLLTEFKQDEVILGECRFDVHPFFAHIGAGHSMCSEIVNSSHQKRGTVNIKVTYYSADFGKLKVRIFHLSLLSSMAEHYKKAKLKVRVGVYMQSSPDWDMKSEFDEKMEMLVLSGKSNLEFEVFNEEGILAQYHIYDLEKSGLLVEHKKAYQVSLFNNDKAVGSIKYQLQWVR